MKIITKIEVQKRNPKRCSVYINDEFAFGMDIDAIGIYRIQKGNKYTEEEYSNLLYGLQYEKAKDTALHYLGYSPRTEKQIIERLQKDEYDEMIIQKTVSFLHTYGYINDYDYAKKFIHDKITYQRHGRNKITYDLMIRGIKKDVIEPILEQYIDTEYENAIYLFNKKSRGQKITDYKEQGKIYRYLQSKGYTYDIIAAVIQESTK